MAGAAGDTLARLDMNAVPSFPSRLETLSHAEASGRLTEAPLRGLAAALSRRRTRTKGAELRV